MPARAGLQKSGISADIDGGRRAPRGVGPVDVGSEFDPVTDDPLGHWNAPFSTDDMLFMSTTRSAQYVFPPSMGLFKTESGGPVGRLSDECRK